MLCPELQPPQDTALTAQIAHRKRFCKASIKVLFFKSRVPLVETARKPRLHFQHKPRRASIKAGM